MKNEQNSESKISKRVQWHSDRDSGYPDGGSDICHGLHYAGKTGHVRRKMRPAYHHRKYATNILCRGLHHHGTSLPRSSASR